MNEPKIHNQENIYYVLATPDSRFFKYNEGKGLLVNDPSEAELFRIHPDELKGLTETESMKGFDLRPVKVLIRTEIRQTFGLL